MGTDQDAEVVLEVAGGCGWSWFWTDLTVFEFIVILVKN